MKGETKAKTRYRSPLLRLLHEDSEEEQPTGRAKRRFVVVSYDITDDRRRTRLCNTLKNFGRHTQYSVFECELSAKDIQRMKQRIKELVEQLSKDLPFSGPARWSGRFRLLPNTQNERFNLGTIYFDLLFE